MIGPAHHVGIAVKDLDAAMERFHLLGLQTDYVEEIPGAGVRVAFLNAGGIHIELLEAMDPKGTVARFLETRGEGIHHVAFSTEDIVAELAQLVAQGFEPVDRAPRTGSRGRKVAFLHPRSAHGVLIELVEEPG